MDHASRKYACMEQNSRIKAVTEEGMVSRQPGINCSVTSGNGRHVLSVQRYYPGLKNEWGGFGVFKRADCDGMAFASSEAAFAFARERGYLRDYRRYDPAFKARRTKTWQMMQARQAA